jgi:hypothetical protein
VLIGSTYLVNVVGLVLALPTVPVFALILWVAFAVIAPMIVASCAIGATRSRTPCPRSGLCSAAVPRRAQPPLVIVLLMLPAIEKVFAGLRGAE